MGQRKKTELSNYTILIDEVAARTGRTKVECKAFITDVFESIKSLLIRRIRVKVPTFGIFSLRLLPSFTREHPTANGKSVFTHKMPRYAPKCSFSGRFKQQIATVELSEEDQLISHPIDDLLLD